MYLRIILILISLLLFIGKLYSQQENSFYIKGKQTYNFQNEIVRIIFTSNTYVDNFDTLKINIEITNVSQKQIYLFKEPIVKYIFRNGLKDGIQINFGGNFTSNIEYDVSMIPLLPDSIIKLNFRYSFEELKIKKVENFIQITFDLGVLSNIEEIKDFLYMNKNLSPTFEIENNELLISSTLLEIYLENFNLASLFLRVKGE